MQKKCVLMAFLVVFSRFRGFLDVFGRFLTFFDVSNSALARAGRSNKSSPQSSESALERVFIRF